MGATGHPGQNHSLTISFVLSWSCSHILCDQEVSVTFVLLLYDYTVK